MATVQLPPGRAADSTKDAPFGAGRQLTALADRVAPWAIALLTLLIYLRTLCPTVFADDCGEIATAIATGGVMHPPGYPLYSLLGRLFVAAVPLGEPAWRIGLISAICAAAASSLTYRLSRVAGAAPTMAIGASLAFAFSLALWRQATKVETYSLNALFFIGIFLTALRYGRSGKSADLALFAAVCGLALTNHFSAVCAVAAAAAIFAPRLCGSERPWRGAALAAIAGGAPLCLYALLWLWSAHNPGGQNWGDPDTARRFFLQTTAARYRVYATGQTLLGASQRDLVDLPAMLWQNLGWFLIGLVPGAARGLLDPKTRAVNTALAVAAVLVFVETSLYGILNIFEYYTPLVLILAIWSAIGWDAILAGVVKRAPRARHAVPAAAAAIVAASVFWAVSAHWSACNRSRATQLRDLAEQTLESMPPHAVLIAVGDNRNFPMWYAQSVLGIRPDVCVVPRNMLSGLGTSDGRAEMGWLLGRLQHQHPRLVDAGALLRRCARDKKFAAAEGPTWQIAVTAMRLGRPVLLTDVLPGDLLNSDYRRAIFTPLGPNFTLVAFGLTSMVRPVNAAGDIVVQNGLDQAVVAGIRIEPMRSALMQDEPDGNIVDETYAQMLDTASDLAYRARQVPTATNELTEVMVLAPTADGYARLGEMYETAGDWPKAIASLRVAASLDPSNEDYADAVRTARAESHIHMYAQPPPEYRH